MKTLTVQRGDADHIRSCMRPKNLVHHPAEEALERYLLHQSSDTEVEAVETHIMACENCVAQLEQLDFQICVTKLALQELHQERVARSYSKEQAQPKRWWSLAGLPVAGALAMAAAVVLSVLPHAHRNVAPVANIQLTAYRGLESKVLPKDCPLHITLNSEGLTGDTARVTMVDSDGVEIWNHVASIRNNVVALDVPGIHSTGTHFLRLYAPGHTEDPLREFSVTVQ